MKRLTSTEVFMAFLVEVIRQLWDHGLYHNNEYLKKCHDEWFWAWTEWKTQKTMQDVDRQIGEMFYETEIEPPLYWEEEEGETPLGGPMGFSYDFDNTPSSSDSVQGTEQREGDGE